MNAPRILTFDIETSPHLSWHFDTRNVFISAIQNVQPSRIVCWAAKWHGRNTVMFQSEVEGTHIGMLHGIRDLLDQADVVVTYNGNGFDIPRVNWEFEQCGIPAPSPYVSVDLYNVVKKEFRSAPFSRSLDYVTKNLSLTGKLAHEGYFHLWLAMNGEDEKKARRAWNVFRRYNKRDVVTTEELFDLLESKITTIPAIGLFAEELPSLEIPDCPRCPDGGRPTRQGYKRTKTRRYARFQCQACARWFSQTRSEMGVNST